MHDGISRSSRRAAALLIAIAPLLAGDATAAATAASADDATIVHVLNRLTYGPLPGDVEKVRAAGLEAWIERQLHPERIPDPGLEARLAGLPTIALAPPELLARYDIPREAKREIQRRRAELGENATEQERRRARRELMAKYAGTMQGTPRQVLEELQQAKVLRAIHSERQLDEVLVDFWMNHFNLYAQKGPLRHFVGQYEREVIRPRAWGRFEELLLATAESPAMLFYLDNWLSADPDASARDRGFGRRSRRGRFSSGPDDRMRRPGSPPGPARKRGLNENYAREIMELHTLGVDGGYTQKDVTEVARCFTGWTIRGLREQRPEFVFDARIHDRGDKIVLGRSIEGGGRDEGRQVIHMLATHPSTARFLSAKLARRFVADEPPPSLVERAAATFRRTDGDIRAVVRTIVTSPEFLAPEARAAKVKTPLELVVSAVRASGARVDSASELAARIGGMGMPLYLQQPPTGYKDTAEAWVSTSGLLARLNFALDLAAGRLRGVPVDVAGLGDDPASRLVPGGLSEATRKTLASEGGAPTDPARLAGLILGSPEFQRR